MVVYPCLTATQNIRLRPQKDMTSISVRDKMGKTHPRDDYRESYLNWASAKPGH